MEKTEYLNGLASDRFYRKIIGKLNATIDRYKNMGAISQCNEHFEELEQAYYMKDAQVNHLLSITNCLLKYVPNSPLLEEIFTNFLKDYIHLVNPEMPCHIGEYYLTDEFVQANNEKKTSQDKARTRYV